MHRRSGSLFVSLPVVVLTLLFSLPLSAQPHAPYRLNLEINPAAPFPFLKKFGTVDVTVYPSGVRADMLFLNFHSRVGSQSFTLENGLARMYAELPITEARKMLVKLGGGKEELMPGLAEFPIAANPVKGAVSGIPAVRYRVMLGTSWIDVWTTRTIPENPQLRRLAVELVSAVSRPAANIVRKIPGTPLYVEMNTRRFKKLPLLRTKSLVRSADGEEKALTRSKLMVKAPFVEALFRE